VIGVRVALATTVLAVWVVAVCFSAPALASSGPSGAQVRRAVSRAESSRSLWATINICNSRTYPDALGVRGQMPTLGFAAVLSMRIQIDYYSSPKKRFVPIPGSTARRQVSLGRWSSNLQQAGEVFPFKAHAGLLNATIQFTWMRAGKVIGQITRQTTAGHKDADYASPPHYSAAQCQIP
jgi:hypothetical protein